MRLRKVVTAVVLELLEPMSEAVIDERSSWEMQGLSGPADLRVLMVDDSSQRAENSSIPCV